VDKSIDSVVKSGLCTSCGLCGASCSSRAITFDQIDGSRLPHIGRNCTNCGICMKICPGTGDALANVPGVLTERMIGNVIASWSAWSHDEKIFANAVSGGIVTQLIKSLLEANVYDAAFLVDGVTQAKDCVTSRFSKDDSLYNSQKSKYVQVSHENTLKYMLAHRDERLIITAVPCATRGLLNAIGLFGLTRENYLFLGLFCDKTMTSNSLNYLASCGNGESLVRIDFRTKAASGWPGDVQLCYQGAKTIDLPSTVRMRVKEYFQPECCLYCMDKLNVRSDISIGDNYTGDGANPKGACSVLIRTKTGEQAWELCSPCIECIPSDLDAIAKSQSLLARCENYHFGLLKELRDDYYLDGKLNQSLALSNVPKASNNIAKHYANRLKKIQIGKSYSNNAKGLERELKKQNLVSQYIIGRCKSLFRKMLRKCKRKNHRIFSR
jgi:coenzyme F420 hydrogenase subunit beta